MQRTLVVTGVSRGLGRELALALAAAGWDVVGTSRSPAGDSAPRHRHVVGDVDDPGTARAVLDALGGRPLDLLVNNAVAGSAQSRLVDIDPDEVARSMAVNVGGPLRMAQALLPALLDAERPLILNVSSRLGSMTRQARGDFHGSGTSYAYRISKAALNMLTICLADELGPRVRCWAVHPGVLGTPETRPGATNTTAGAADQLLDLVGSGDMRPLRFCSLGEDDMPW